MSTHDDRTLPYFQRDDLLLAPYAMHSRQSAGRKHPEPLHLYRGPFHRDRDRITHSAAYRRLSSKTQVFTGEAGDYHRTRLTHTLEVASIARTLARALQLNEDLVEALALTHDLGHPPYGHAGEDVLDECLAGHGGFSHNEQGLRIVELLEQRYPEFPGLNLSIEVLEGQATRIKRGQQKQRPLLEVQLVEAADSVAYDTHDADDALQLGLLTLDELAETALWREAIGRVRDHYADLQGSDLKRAVLHELIDWQVGDLLGQIRLNIARLGVATVADVRSCELIVRASSELAAKKIELERFLYQRVYRHPQVLAQREPAQNELRQLFARYAAQPELMPQRYGRWITEHGLARTVVDYLAGMTDRFARQEHARLFASGE